MIKAVIFDLDGVIADSRAQIAENLRELFQEFGFPRPDKEKIAAVDSLGSRRIIEGLLPEGRKGDAELVEKMRERFAKVSEEKISGIRPVKGAGELLAYLRSKGMKAAIATNRGQTSYALIRSFGFEGMFEAVVVSGDVKNLKPHPESLLLALKRLSVSPQEAVFVGDSEADAAAGLAAGIKTVLFAKKCAGCETVGSLHEIKRLVE